MQNPDQGFAQMIYLAQMFAQKNTCQCEACQLMRKATDGMISQMIKGVPASEADSVQSAIQQALSISGQVPADPTKEV